MDMPTAVGPAFVVLVRHVLRRPGQGGDLVRQREPRGGPAGRARDGRADVSVVITCYNYARYLEGAVQSVTSQQGVTVEVIVVDDASTDSSLDVARKLEAADDRVSVVSLASNSGPVAAFNEGLRHACAEFVVRLDADDLLTPGSLVRSVSVARENPSVGLVYGHPLHFHSSRAPARQRVTGVDLWRGGRWLELRCRAATNVITSPEVLMTTELVRALGGMRPLDHAHDMELWFRMAAFSDVAYIRGADQAWHREHPDSLSRRVDELVDLHERRAAFATLFSGPAGDLERAAQLHDVAKRALARGALRTALQAVDRGRAHRPTIEQLLTFAEAVWPEITASRGWTSLGQRLERWDRLSVRMRVVGTAKAAARGADWRGRLWIWHRRGVYEWPWECWRSGVWRL